MTSHPKVAIVTGASKGIGAAIARRLGAEGLRVVVNYAASADDARHVVADIAAKGGEAIAVQADISRPEGSVALFDAAEARFGGVDFLINNAGVLHVSPIAEVRQEDYERQIATNLDGAFYGLREGAKRIRDGGRIINLSSSIVGTYLPGHGVYVATKAAIEAMTHVLAKELGPRQITVNAVSPGPVATELFLTGRSEALITKLVSEIPMGRLGEPEDIARVVAFLVGPDAAWVSGQVLRANGGRN